MQRGLRVQLAPQCCQVLGYIKKSYDVDDHDDDDDDVDDDHDDDDDDNHVSPQPLSRKFPALAAK